MGKENRYSETNHTINWRRPRVTCDIRRTEIKHKQMWNFTELVSAIISFLYILRRKRNAGYIEYTDVSVNVALHK